MNSFAMRRIVAAVIAAGLASATFAVPASADELDEDAVARELCGPRAVSYDSEFAESGDEAEAGLHTYEIEPAGDATEDDDAQTQLCTFAIISTDEGSTLDGTYTLAAGSAQATGTVSGESFTTKAVLSELDDTPSASLSASGQQITRYVKRVPTKVSTPKTSAQKKAAKKKYDKAVKAAKKAYAKAGRTAKAKKAMNKKIKAAKKRYKAAVATSKIVKKRTTFYAKRSYALQVTLPFDH